MKYLRRFWITLRGCIDRSPTIVTSGFTLQAIVAPHEHLTRFLTSSSHYGAERVKPNAFMPMSGSTKISVFRIDKLREHLIWELGKSIGLTPERKLHGRGDFAAHIVSQQDLWIEPDNVPPRHANITGFPLEKSEQKQIALELAAEATLVLKP